MAVEEADWSGSLKSFWTMVGLTCPCWEYRQGMVARAQYLRADGGTCPSKLTGQNPDQRVLFADHRRHTFTKETRLGEILVSSDPNFPEIAPIFSSIYSSSNARPILATLATFIPCEISLAIVSPTASM